MKQICELFQELSVSIWRGVSENNANGNELSEDGITKNTIVSSIQRYVKSTRDRRIFAQRAIDEKRRGADLEIYIEVDHDSYLRFMFQAKVLKRNGKYNDVAHSNNKYGGMQWDLLQRFSKTAGCQAYYLFYNGVAGFKHSGKDCFGVYNQEQLGCSIAGISYVKKYCIKNNVSKIPFMVAVPFSIPWRVLPCCQKVLMPDALNLGHRSYSSTDIDMDSSFDEIFGEQSSPFIGDPELAESEIINDRLLDLGWTPSVRIVISISEIEKEGPRFLELA
ncbi:MAG: hypothetical protein IPN99_09825 [Bacteroidetes bacterium]|nr:hypothetical protein [Bacteroidota bacterium]